MKRIARTLEVSVAAHSASANDEVKQHRRDEIAALPGGIGREVVTRVNAFSERFPNGAKMALDGLALAIGQVRYVGNGSWSSVYRQGDEVLKVYRRTAPMTDAERAAYVEERDEMCAELHRQMGDIVVAQKLGIETHPLGDYQVAVARQPYVKGRGMSMFKINTLDLNRDILAEYCERQPAAGIEIGDLVAGTFAAHDTYGLVPDINGVDNFRLVGENESLRLIDSEPIREQEFPGVHDLILRQAETLDAFLAA